MKGEQRLRKEDIYWEMPRCYQWDITVNLPEGYRISPEGLERPASLRSIRPTPRPSSALPVYDVYKRQPHHPVARHADGSGSAAAQAGVRPRLAADERRQNVQVRGERR